MVFFSTVARVHGPALEALSLLHLPGAMTSAMPVLDTSLIRAHQDSKPGANLQSPFPPRQYLFLNIDACRAGKCVRWRASCLPRGRKRRTYQHVLEPNLVS